MTNILHTDAFTQTGAYTQGCCYTRVLLHRDVFHKDMFFFLQTLTRTDAFTQRCLYAQLPLLSGAFNQGIFLHGAAFAHRHAGASTHRCLYTSMLLHTCALHRKSCDTEYLLKEKTFAQILLCGDVRRFYTQIYLYTGVFYTHTHTPHTPQILLQRGVLHRYFYTEMLLHTGAFRLGCF